MPVSSVTKPLEIRLRLLWHLDVQRIDILQLVEERVCRRREITVRLALLAKRECYLKGRRFWSHASVSSSARGSGSLQTKRHSRSDNTLASMGAGLAGDTSS